MLKIHVLFVFATSLLLNACSTTFSEQMMADGNTWRISVSDLGACNGYSSSESCTENARPLMERRGTEICNTKPYRIFACGKSTPNGFVAVTCNVQCKQATEIQISNKSQPADAVPIINKPALMEKAKKCQSKGGVWLNDHCEIDVD